MTEAACPLCQKVTAKVLSSALRRGAGTVFNCTRCDLGFLVAEPRDEVAHYKAGYRETVSHKARPVATNPQEIFDVYSRYQDQREKIVRPFVRKNSRILEVGASAGQFLHRFVNDPVARVAVEPDMACRRFMFSMGIKIHGATLGEVPDDRKFNIICAFQVLEHVADPVSFLATIRAAMKPRGAGSAFIEVPSLDDPIRSVWGIPEYEPFYFHRDHLFYFSESSLKKAARMAGFDRIHIAHTQDYSIMNHLHWIINKGPQPTCEAGLGKIDVPGKNREIARWLSDQLTALNKRYVSLLQDARTTSNLMAVLTN